jgi:hypothetical protein
MQSFFDDSKLLKEYKSIYEARRNSSESVRGLNEFLSQLYKAHSYIPADMILDVKDFIEQSLCPEIVFEPLRGALGISLSDKCVVSLSVLQGSLDHCLYVIFHELAHQYQYSKHGENFVEELYKDQIPVIDAAKTLIKIEVTADRYAINKVKQLFQNYFPDKPLRLNSVYKNVPVNFIVQHLQKIRDRVKLLKLTNIDDINQTIYNDVKGHLQGPSEEFTLTNS